MPKPMPPAAQLQRYHEALHAIRGAVLLATAVQDPVAWEVLLDEIRTIVEIALGQAQRQAANEWERR